MDSGSSHPRLVAIPSPSAGVYRLARGPGDPFTPPDWVWAQPDGTFGNRFDDPSALQGVQPEDRFRVLYCATHRAATFGETVARFRLDLALLAALDTIDDDEPVTAALGGALDPLDPYRGVITADWRLKRRMGHTVLDPSLRFVDISHVETMQCLRAELASTAVTLGLADVDLSTLTSSDRQFTQVCARYVHDLLTPIGAPMYAGVRYVSRLNPEWECWAVFDDRVRHAHGYPSFPSAFSPNDPDLLEVARLFNLSIEILPGQSHYLRR